MRSSTMATAIALLRSTTAFVPSVGPVGALSRVGSTTSVAQRSIHRSSSALNMVFWKPPPTSEHTRLAKKPALDKCKPDAEWKEELGPNTFQVLRGKATEPAGVRKAQGGFDDVFDKGTYVCAGCRTPLYEDSHKFDCGCGWPGFWTNIQDAVYEEKDADGRRCEILCSGCGGHLGHVFRGEGFGNPEPNERHCVNSVSLAFIPEGKTDGPDAVECTYTGGVYGGTA
ncbi:unnamed protein product [Pylaiella littoralis]